MRRIALPIIVILAFMPLSALSQDLLANAKAATVFIANFNAAGDFVGWGSGFFVDEGIVVTNKHVIEGGKYYKLFATKEGDAVNLDCAKEFGRSDVKVNLDDDAAYIRAYVDCPHGVVRFAPTDPPIGDEIGVLGFPARAAFADSLHLSYTQGVVTGRTPDGWLGTDAYLHFGNSGGPVVNNGQVVGIAVAKATDENGRYVSGYFVPGSVVMKGLLYANNSTFGYTPQSQQNNAAYGSTGPLPYGDTNDPFDPPRQNRDATNADCRQHLGDGAEAIGYGGCRCKANYHRSASGTACVPGGQGQEMIAIHIMSSSSSSSVRSRLLRPLPKTSSSSSSSKSSSSSLSLHQRLAARKLARQSRNSRK